MADHEKTARDLLNRHDIQFPGTFRERCEARAGLKADVVCALALAENKGLRRAATFVETHSPLFGTAGNRLAACDPRDLDVAQKLYAEGLRALAEESPD